MALTTPFGELDLDQLIPNSVTRAQVRALLTPEALRDGMSIPELMQATPQYAAQTHFSRRLRDADKVFEIERLRRGRVVHYRIVGLRAITAETARVSPRLRARVLFRDGSRCQMCGASPATDARVRLEVDHRLPLDLGGNNEEENLWTLCRICNQGKRAFFATIEEHRDQLKLALGYEEVHRRLGEALRAFGVGVEVPSSVLEIVASAQQYQEDWHRRLRELRDLGWEYSVHKRKERGRMVSYYVLEKDGGWPSDGSIRDSLRRS